MPSPSFTALKSRQYFMIIDKDDTHPNKPYFELVLFDLIKDDPIYREIQYKDLPFFQGVVQFEIDEQTNHYVPFRLWKRVKDPNTKEDVLNFVDPGNFRNFLIFACFAVIGNHLNQPQGHNLENFQIVDADAGEIQKSQMDLYMKQLEPVYDYVDTVQYKNVRNYLFCQHCKLNKKFTLIDANTRFKSQAFYVCKDCAGKEVLRMLKTKVDVTPQLKAYLRDLLIKYNDINKVINVFSPNFNILQHTEATLVGVSKAMINPKALKSYPIKDFNLPLPLQYYYLHQKKTFLLPAQAMAVEQGLLEGQNELIVSATSSGKTMIGELAGLGKILQNKMNYLEKQGNLCPLKPINSWSESDVDEKEDELFTDKAEPKSHPEKNSKSLPEEITESSETPTKIPFSPEEKKYLELLKETRTLKKMLYLVPIVALANMRFGEYELLKKYGIKTALRIGISHMNKKNRNKDEFGDWNHADVIIATYEALDILLRSGRASYLKDIATVVVDEIQMLADPERGFILDGLIGRMRLFNPSAQYLYLSATISDPEGLASHLHAALVKYEDRPVPIERHMVMCMDENIKMKNLALLVREEFKKKSSFGFQGQTIIFTNSRKNTEFLAEFLSNNHIRAMAYHAGLTYEMRKSVERSFTKQKIMAVVTTAALAAGVDFPASQVIFASLTMGIKWLTVAEFEQMAGRAGRYKKHDSGKVYLLITPGRMYTGAQNDTEEHIAMHLLKGQIEPLNLPSEESAHFTEILAVIAMYSSSNEEERGISLKDLQFYHSLLYNNAFYFNVAINTLVQQGFIKLIRNQSEAVTTRFGRAVGETFLRTDKALQIKEALTVPVSEEKSAPDLLKLAQDMDPFKNVYVTNRGLSEMSSKNQAKPTSNNLFSNAILSLMTADSLAKKGHLSNRFYEILLKWSDEIFNCTCQDKPYCECAREHIQEILLESRFQGMSLDGILLYLADMYEIQIFHGDLTDWFEQLIYSLQAIFKIGQTLKVPPQTMLRIQNIPNVIDQLIHAKKPENIEDEEDN